MSRDGGGGHGPAVAAVPPGHQRAATTPAHGSLRACPGVLAAGSQWRARITPPVPPPAATEQPERTWPAGGYRRWAELSARTFAVDVLCCPSCQGRMRLLAVIKESASITRYLAAVGEATEVPRRSPSRGPPYWKSQVLRRKALGDRGSHGNGADEVA